MPNGAPKELGTIDGEDITVGGVKRAEVNGASQPTSVTVAKANGTVYAQTINPDGKYEFINYNFRGNTSGITMYGVNTVGVIRYGAFGDILQTSSVLPLLQKQGYRVCVNTNETGKDILRSNPYVDELLVQRTNQIYPKEIVKEVFGALGYKDGERFVMMEQNPQVAELTAQLEEMQGYIQSEQGKLQNICNLLRDY